MKIIRLLRGLEKYIILMILFSVVQVFCELYLPNIMSNIVDIGIKSNDTSYIMNNTVKMGIIALIGLLSNIIVVYTTSKFSNKYGYNIRECLYKKITTFSKKEIDKFGASTLITRSTDNVNAITSTFSFGLRLIIFSPIMGIGAAIMGYNKAPELSKIILIAVIILLIFLTIVFILVFPKFEVSQKLFDKLNSKTREILSGLRVIKSYNKEDYFEKRFNKVNEENKNLNIFLYKILYLVQPMMILTINIATIVIIYVSINYLSDGTIQIGSLIAFIQYLSIILISFMIMLVLILNIPRVFVSIKRINEVLNTDPSIKNSGNKQIEELKSIEFKHVYFKYEGAKNEILKDISFKINEKENIGIIGSSGSGKTTIVNLLLRHIEPTQGQILINDIDIKEYSETSLRNMFSYTPQKSLLFKGTIKENLSFDKKYKTSELDEVMEIASIKDFINKNKNGYNYKVEGSAVNLSGGQKQRISIARALLNDGECLLFDDSFSAVDYITDKKIRNELNKNYKDKMKIIITQRVGTIKDADKIIVIDEGKIESIGSYYELSKNSKVFKEFIDSQKREVLS